MIFENQQDQEEIKENLFKLDPGKYYKTGWLKEVIVNGHTYIKFSRGVVRFGNFYDKVKVSATTIKNSHDTYVPGLEGILKFNSKTNNFLVNIYLTKNSKHKVKCAYFMDGEEITKEEYEKAVPSKPNSSPSILFCKKLQDIVYIIVNK